MLIDKIASDDVIDVAYEWMCDQRAHHHFNSDVWQIRRWGDEKKPLLQQQLRSGRCGKKAAVREVEANLPNNQFVFRTDVKGYYASFNHHI